MSSSAPPESIFSRAFDVKQSLIDLLEGLRAENNDDQHQAAIKDVLDRFGLWAGNLGALHRPTLRISLDHRLLEAPRIRVQICEHLDDIREAISDLTLFKLGGDHDSAIPSPFDDESEGTEEDFDIDIEEPPVDDARILLNVISKGIRFLFRIGVFVRRLAPVDRFQRALQRSDPIPAWAYVNHVKDKYRKLARDDAEWLAKRLGTASAKRKQFIMYSIDHDARLQSDYTDTATERLSSMATPLTFRTKGQDNRALELVVGDEEQPEDDTVSLMTALTTFDNRNTLRLPSLADLSPNDEPFPCPICRTLQSFRTEKAWKIHAFRDLQAYVCTIGGPMCEQELFSDRESWFNHELRSHRSYFNCILCDEGGFDSSDAMSRHITTVHGYLPEDGGLSKLVEAGINMPTHLNAKDCPFCDEWGASKVSQGGLVKAVDFKRHVATHQEQLAIFVARESIQGDEDDQNEQEGSDEKSLRLSLVSDAASDDVDKEVGQDADSPVGGEELGQYQTGVPDQSGPSLTDNSMAFSGSSNSEVSLHEEPSLSTLTEEDKYKEVLMNTRAGQKVAVTSMSLLDKMKHSSGCTAGYEWKKEEHGWRCAGGSHLLTDEEFAAL